MTDFPYTLKGMQELETSNGVAFVVNLCRGQKKIATVENDGRGGADMVYIGEREEQALWNAWIQTLPPFRYAPDEYFPEGLEIENKHERAIDHLLKVHDDARA